MQSLTGTWIHNLPLEQNTKECLVSGE